MHADHILLSIGRGTPSMDINTKVLPVHWFISAAWRLGIWTVGFWSIGIKGREKTVSDSDKKMNWTLS